MFLSDDACANVPVLLDAHFPPKVRALWNAGLAGRLVCEAVQCLNRRCVSVSVPVSVSVSLMFSGTAPAASPPRQTLDVLRELVRLFYQGF